MFTKIQPSNDKAPAVITDVMKIFTQNESVSLFYRFI